MLHGMMLDSVVTLAQTQPAGIASTLVSILLLVAGFSLVIFVHELGHFLAAKWAKVHVERFAIGFARPLFSYRKGIGLCAGSTQSKCDRRVAEFLGHDTPARHEGTASEEGDNGPSSADRARAAEALGLGETEYCFNMLPLGGYVKMLGQEDFVVDKSGELKVKENPNSFTNKSIGTRMVIISAGVIMNLLFAAIAFAIVVMVGLLQPPAIVGDVRPDSPANRAGLQTGDKILAINGTTIRNFGDLSARIMLSDPNEELVMTVLRDGKTVTPAPRIKPEFKKEAQIRQIGVAPGTNRRVLLASLRPNEEPLPHDLHKNDELFGFLIDGQPKEFKSISTFYRGIMHARGAPVDVVVKRPEDPTALSTDTLLESDPDIASTDVTVQIRAVWAPLAYTQKDDISGSLLGLVPRMTVLAPMPDKSFEKAGVLPGDVIVKIGPHLYPTPEELKQTITGSPDIPVPIEVARRRVANGGLAAGTVEFCVQNRETLILAAMADVAKALEKLARLAGAAGLPDAEREKLTAKLTEAGDGPGWRAWLERADVHTLDPIVPKRQFALFKRPPPKVDAALRCIDEDHLVVAGVIHRFGGRITPAKAAGIPRGAVILEANGRPVRQWFELSGILRASAGGEVELTYRVLDEVRSTTMAVPLCISAALDLPPGARIVKIDGLSSREIQIPTEDGKDEARTEEIALPDWRVTEALLADAIGRTVEIEYVTYDGEKHTAGYAVTADNTDPWLHRVRFVPSFACYPLLERHPVRNPILAVGVGFRQAYQTAMRTIQSIRHMIFTRQVGVSKISGPVGILRLGTRAADLGSLNLLWFLAVISASLAVINFLPMPIVDGGLFLFLLMEKVRGEPVSIKTQVATQLIGIALIATLFLLVTYQDIKHWILGT